MEGKNAVRTNDRPSQLRKLGGRNRGQCVAQAAQRRRALGVQLAKAAGVRTKQVRAKWRPAIDHNATPATLHQTRIDRPTQREGERIFSKRDREWTKTGRQSRESEERKRQTDVRERTRERMPLKQQLCHRNDSLCIRASTRLIGRIHGVQREPL